MVKSKPILKRPDWITNQIIQRMECHPKSSHFKMLTNLSHSQICVPSLHNHLAILKLNKVLWTEYKILWTNLSKSIKKPSRLIRQNRTIKMLMSSPQNGLARRKGQGSCLLNQGGLTARISAWWRMRKHLVTQRGLDLLWLTFKKPASRLWGRTLSKGLNSSMKYRI